MSFIKNKLEDWENYLVEMMNSQELSKIREEREQLNELKASIKYSRADINYLFQRGFGWEPKLKGYSKEEDIDYGRYPGKYRILVYFPDAYPRIHPTICFKPLFKIEKDNVSHHIDRPNSNKWDAGEVCIAETQDGTANTYWKSNMNARGALMLAYGIITDEYARTRGSRREIPIQGTVFEKIRKIVSRNEFIEEFMKVHNINDIDRTFNWGELAYKVSQQSGMVKSELVKYYNLRRKNG